MSESTFPAQFFFLIAPVSSNDTHTQISPYSLLCTLNFVKHKFNYHNIIFFHKINPLLVSVKSLDLAAIEFKRSMNPLNNLSPQERGPGNYQLVCPNCDKPNALTSPICTCCALKLSPRDLAKSPDNVFLDIIAGKREANIRFRSPDYVVFDDAFGVSYTHIDVVPTRLFEDISHLNRSHLPMLQGLVCSFNIPLSCQKKNSQNRTCESRQTFLTPTPSLFLEMLSSLTRVVEMYAIGFEVLRQMDLTDFGNNNIDDYLVAGFTYPVSVKQLHLHMVLPPFKHDKVIFFRSSLLLSSSLLRASFKLKQSACYAMKIILYYRCFFIQDGTRSKKL